MIRFFLGLIAIIFSTTAINADNWILQGNTYNVDTINHIKVGPGTTLTSLRLTGHQNLNIF